MSPAQLVSLVDLTTGEAGFKAERLARALHAGLPVLPGWVVPVSANREVLLAGSDAVRASGLAAGRVAVLGRAVDAGLEAGLRAVVNDLGGRVIVRSSSPLEGDPAWSGAFSSVAGVGADDVAGAVRSCWASAFALDPLQRAEARGLALEALELAVLVQPEIVPEAGGVARIEPGSVPDISVAGVRGHPGPMLSGWADGAHDAGLASLIGPKKVADVAALARSVHAELGDNIIEWAACAGKVWLLQAGRSGPPAAAAATAPDDLGALASAAAPVVAGGTETALAAAIWQRGARVPAYPAAPGQAAGHLMPVRPHQSLARDCRGAILLVHRPVPALAPLIFGACGLISQSAAVGSHLAQVARSLGIPMVTGCHPETVTGAGAAPGTWLAAINGATGDVVLAPKRPQGAPPPLLYQAPPPAPAQPPALAAHRASRRWR